MVNIELNQSPQVNTQPTNEVLDQIMWEDPDLIHLTRAAMEYPEDPQAQALEILGRLNKESEEQLSVLKVAGRLHEFYNDKTKFSADYYQNLVQVLQEFAQNGPHSLDTHKEGIEAGLKEHQLLVKNIEEVGFDAVLGRKVIDRLAVQQKAPEMLENSANSFVEDPKESNRHFKSQCDVIETAVEAIPADSSVESAAISHKNMTNDAPVMVKEAKKPVERKHRKKVPIGTRINTMLNYTPLLGKDFDERAVANVDPSPYPKHQLPKELHLSNQLESHWRQARTKRGLAGIAQLAMIGTNILLNAPAEQTLAPALIHRMESVERLIDSDTTYNSDPANSRDTHMVRSIGKHSIRAMRMSLQNNTELAV
ncbi:MAG: hypothetical protein NVSMB46_01880 [Candidatus Saccharimonadales bacterium]